MPRTIPSTTPAVAKIQAFLGDVQPIAALVLGSGLGDFAETGVQPLRHIQYEDIPGFPVSTVEGHAGRLVLGMAEGAGPVLCFQGRFHHYEGYKLGEITFPVRVLADLGVRTLILTNAAGGIRADLTPGTLMLIADHINMLGSNPLIGPNIDEHGGRFTDMTEAYDTGLRKIAAGAAQVLGIDMREGIYLATTGPSFETPAEIRAFRVLGADAVGMSTVPECIVANHAGMRVLGISCITNTAAGLGEGKLSHEEVFETAAAVHNDFVRLLLEILRRV